MKTQRHVRFLRLSNEKFNFSFLKTLEDEIKQEI